MPKKNYDVVLVQMPHTWLQPSIALGLLKSELNKAGISSKVEYANAYFIDRIGFDRYEFEIKNKVALIFRGWELVFSKFTSFTPKITVEKLLEEVTRTEMNNPPFKEIYESLPDEHKKNIPETIMMLIDEAESFLEDEAEKILAMNPRVVGFSIMTEQRNASFAMCKKLKEKRPDIITVIGGGVCSEKVAEQFLKEVADVDYVFTGDGDIKFAEGMRLIMDGREKELNEKIPHFCKRGAKPVMHFLYNLNRASIPDYDDFFETVEQTNVIDKDKTLIFVEASRGCWWGEKQGCRFCGLHYHPDAVKYRAKTTEQFFNELDYLSEKYNVNRFMMTDCILHYNLCRELSFDIPKHRKKYALFAECKSNMSLEEMRKLKANGFYRLQPGIEALQDDVLKLMNKGASCLMQLEFLKNARICGIYIVWNIIHTLPGEKKQWWLETLELMERIHHLPPPTSINQMLLSRGSEFEKHLEKYTDGGKFLRMCDIAVDPPSEEFTYSTADSFGIYGLKPDEEIVSRLHKETAKWKSDFYEGRYLLYREVADRILVFDTRFEKPAKKYFLGGIKKDVFLLSLNRISVKRLKKQISEKYAEPDIGQKTDEIVKEFDSNKIVWIANGSLLNLALPEKLDKYDNRI